MHPIKINGILQNSCFFLLHVLSTLCFFVICCSCCSLYQTFCRFYYLTITLYVAKIKFSSYSWIIFNVQVFELNERTHSQWEYSKVCFRSFIGYFLWISFRFFIAPARREPVESEEFYFCRRKPVKRWKIQFSFHHYNDLWWDLQY